MALTPEQEAELRAQIVGSGPAAPDLSVGDQLRAAAGRLMQYPATARTILPVVGVSPDVQSSVARIGQDIAPPMTVPQVGAPSAPFNPDAGGFAPKLSRAAEPAPLKPLYVPDVNVEAAPQLTMPQVGRGAGGFGGSAGVSGIGDAAAAYRDAQGRQVGLIGKEADQQSRIGVAQADRTDAVSDLEAADAARKAEDARREAGVEAEAQKGLSDFMSTNARMADDIANAKVDRRRIFKDMSTGDRVVFGLAAVLGGMMQGLQGQKTNQFLDYVERTVDKDVEDQMKAVDNKKSTLAARQNMFGQLLQQTGDRRIAAMQLRNLQYEAMKQATTAQADKLGIPVLLEQSDMARNQIEQKQAALQTQLAAEVYKQKQAAAAAAAASQRAAEEKSWQRQMELAKLGLEQDKLKIEAAKASGETKKDLNQRVADLGKALGDPKLQEGRAVTDALAAQLENTPKGDQLNGLGWGSRAVAALPGGEHLLSDQANINRQNWEDFLGVIRHMKTGAGGSAKEMETIRHEAEGASTAAEKANVIKKAQAYFARQEASFRAGVGPEASAQYDQNMVDIGKQMPASVDTVGSGKPPFPSYNPDNPWTKK